MSDERSKLDKLVGDVYQKYAPYETSGRIVDAMKELARRSADSDFDVNKPQTEEEKVEETSISVLDLDEKYEDLLNQAGLDTVEEIERFVSGDGKLHRINGIGRIGARGIKDKLIDYRTQ